MQYVRKSGDLLPPTTAAAAAAFDLIKPARLYCTVRYGTYYLLIRRPSSACLLRLLYSN